MLYSCGDAPSCQLHRSCWAWSSSTYCTLIVLVQSICIAAIHTVSKCTSRACCCNIWGALQLDPDFTATVDLIRRGTFGYEDFFSDVLDSITRGPDYYLLANDFQSYIQAQVMLVQLHKLALPCVCCHLYSCYIYTLSETYMLMLVATFGIQVLWWPAG